MKTKQIQKGLLIYRLTLFFSALVGCSLAIFTIVAINNLDIYQWAKGIIFLDIGIVLLIISKAMSKDVEEAKRQILSTSFEHAACTKEKHPNNSHYNAVIHRGNKENREDAGN